MIREIKAGQITAAVRELSISACRQLGSDWWAAMERAEQAETDARARQVLALLQENARLARREGLPICQDTGITVVFLAIGQDVHITGGDLNEAVAEGVRQGYRDGYLRKSIVADPLLRVNTGDNTPPVIYSKIVPGDQLRITVAPKGIGSENMSAMRMLRPADGRAGVVRFVLEVVEKAGANPCPPLLIGVGMGGTMDKAAVIAKRSLLRPIGEPHPDQHIADLEKELLKRVNGTGIGPAGLGGVTTALAVHVQTWPTHIGGLPVAVNLQCHAARHAEVVL
ncbi:MAG: fumarate hydratase [Bacillota bacterium]|jgi:fumarate hydratase subunit alpha